MRPGRAGSAKAGAVKVRKSGAATVVDYDKTNGVALTEGASQWITITNFKDKAVNEIIDGYNAAAVPDGLVADRLELTAVAFPFLCSTENSFTEKTVFLRTECSVVYSLRLFYLTVRP